MLHTFLESRMDTSELDQSDGKWVLFDLHAPADKILDRDLIPIVERYCADILKMDDAYMGAAVEFTDKQGHVWRRVK
jgi:hypothetical protein